MAVLLYYLRRAERNIIIILYCNGGTAHGRILLYRRDPAIKFLQLILSILYLGSITYIVYVCKHDITTKASKKLIFVVLLCHGC